jgi:hypothetical protein
MATKITRDIIESYLNCKYKGHLRLDEQQGVKSDYELLLAESRDKVKRWATDKIRARYQGKRVECDVVVAPAALKRGAIFLLDATLEDEHVSLTCDGLQQVPGPSKLGNFHYIPVLFAEGRQIRKEQRALLGVYGLLIARLQGRAPGSGIIWHGKQCQATRVPLHPLSGVLRHPATRQARESIPRILPGLLRLGRHFLSRFAKRFSISSDKAENQDGGPGQLSRWLGRILRHPGRPSERGVWRLGGQRVARPLHVPY